jgi:hypothetical protein
MTVQKTLIEACGNYNFIQIEDHMKWNHLRHKQMGHFKVNTWSQRNFIQADYNNRAWI